MIARQRYTAQKALDIRSGLELRPHASILTSAARSSNGGKRLRWSKAKAGHAFDW